MTGQPSRNSAHPLSPSFHLSRLFLCFSAPSLTLSFPLSVSSTEWTFSLFYPHSKKALHPTLTPAAFPPPSRS